MVEVQKVRKPRLPLVEPDEKTAKFLDDLMNNYEVDLPVEQSSGGEAKAAPKRASTARVSARR
jgi:hypothetical protein